MALSTRDVPRLVLALATLALVGATAGLDLPRASRGEFFAGYLKPPNVLMAAPLGLEPLLPRDGVRLVLGPPFERR